VPPALAILVGYYEQSLTVEYVILTLFVCAAYLLLNQCTGPHAHTLRAFDRHDAVAGRDE